MPKNEEEEEKYWDIEKCHALRLPKEEKLHQRVTTMLFRESNSLNFIFGSLFYLFSDHFFFFFLNKSYSNLVFFFRDWR